MSIDLCKDLVAEDIDIDDEIDLDEDEYGDNPQAMSKFALVLQRKDWYDSENYPWVTLRTDQGSFDFPAGHLIKVKVIE